MPKASLWENQKNRNKKSEIRTINDKPQTTNDKHSNARTFPEGIPLEQSPEH